MVFKEGINCDFPKIKREVHLDKLTWVLIILGIIALLFTAYYSFLLISYDVGDYIYNKNTLEVGSVQGIDVFKLGYLIKWGSGNYSSASVWSIDSVSNIDTSDVSDLPRNISNATSVSGVGSKFTPEDNFNDYIVSSENDNSSATTLLYFSDSGQFNYTGKTSCSSDFSCSDWGICHLDYNLNIILQNKPLTGKSYRFCKDNNQCLPNIIDSKSCEDKINITTQLTRWCGQDYLEIIDDSGTVLARLSNQDQTDYLDVNLNILDNGYCYYCYDGKRDFDETGKDCGGPCLPCLKKLA